jgi:cysteine desulfuration protein SufE
MNITCLQKQSEVCALFLACPTEDDKYQKIIELGRKMSPLDTIHKIPENVVKGCQSVMYLRSTFKEGLVYFEAESEALISSGLAAILVNVYSGETPETILTCPPTYLDQLGISAKLTPSRANGLYSIHLRMKQDALRFLLAKK